MGTKDERTAEGDFIDRINKCHTLFLEALNDDPVVNDFVVHKKIWPHTADSLIEAFNGHLNTGTETTRAGEQNVHGLP
jgi:hypothetical protein